MRTMYFGYHMGHTYFEVFPITNHFPTPCPPVSVEYHGGRLLGPRISPYSGFARQTHSLEAANTIGLPTLATIHSSKKKEGVGA
jgi:hypothetical protein